MVAERNNHAARLSTRQIPTADEAIASYVGHLSAATQFGIDPLSGSPQLFNQRERELEENIPSPEDLFSYTVNGNYLPFAQSLKYLIDTTNRLQSLL